ncbi:MAG TPA: nucleoside hydrolase [Pirellulales bacterium]|jgi:purine nucleosidase|nr:nucleoside hydrolase [Pirellulales bacterium]
MARKVILDVDPGIADALALAMALFDPRLDVVAITATGGNVSPEQATKNVQALVEQLDPPRWPRIGAASKEQLPASDSRRLFGADGLGNANLPFAELHNIHPSDKVIYDEVRAAPEEITIVALGPLTNLALAIQRDPNLASQIGGLVMLGGTLSGPGNVTPVAEFNIYCDPAAAQVVFRSPITKTLIPLDVTSRLVFSFDFLKQLPDETSRAGMMLQSILPHAYRTHRQLLGIEGIHLHEAVALTAVTNPELFETSDLAGDVETTGELTLGATIFDQRNPREWRTNMDVAVDVEAAAVQDNILRALALCAK